MSPHEGARVALYCRVSTNKQAEHGHSLDGQLERLRAFAEAQGYQVVDTIVESESAGGHNRKRLERLRERIEATGAEAVVVTKKDRIARSLRDLLNLTHELQRTGIHMIAADEPFDTSTPQGRAMFGMQGVFAELEKDLVGERTKEGMAAAKAKGVHVGRPPFGFKMEKATDDEGNPVRGRLVKGDRYDDLQRIVKLRQQGLSIVAIAERLTDERMPTSAGKIGRWYPAQVQRALAGASRLASED